MGGDSDVKYNSSFNGKVTIGSNVYTCKSQKAFDACNNINQQDCSACELTGTDQSATITTVCVQSASNAFAVNQTGCVLKLKTGDSTGVCNGNTLKILTGVGFSKATVLSQGATFSGAVTLNSQLIQCNSL